MIGDIVWQDSYANSDKLHKVSKERFDELFPNPGASDATYEEPYYYCLYGNKFYIGPVPDKTSYTYQINYTTEAAITIASGTSSVPFTDKYRWILRDIVLGEFMALHLNQYNMKVLNNHGIGLNNSLKVILNICSMYRWP